MKFYEHNERGFTLLLAALVSSLVLSLGIAIVSIARKSVTLSSIGRDSQFAFYAADAGAECALYWDIRHNQFGTSTPPSEATCDGEILSMSGRAPSEPYTIEFMYEPNGYCVGVNVLKSTSHPRTVIHSDGYSVSCSDVSSHSRSLQRSVELRY